MNHRKPSLGIAKILPTQKSAKVVLGSSSVRYEVGLFRNDAQEAAAEGFFVHVYVDRATRRPKPLDDRLRATLEAIAT